MPVHPELIDLLAAVETLLQATGEAVALCPNYGCGTATGPRRDGGRGVCELTAADMSG